MQKSVALMLCSALAAAPLSAQEAVPASNEIGDVYIPAEPLKRSAPNYPASSLSNRREGWVLVSFIISEEGEVIEPMIEDSSNPDFDTPTLRAIQRWRYKPATVGGKPVEQSMVQTMIRYKLADAKGASPSFVRKYRAAYALIGAKNIAEAAPLVQQLEEGEQNYYETAWFWWLKYAYLDTTGTAEPRALMQALDKALGNTETEDDAYLEPDVFVVASQRLYAMRARSGDLSGALAVYERLKASKTARRSKLYDDVVASLEPSHGEIMSLVAGPKILRQAAQVDEHHYWVHRMLRRSFALGDVANGKLDLVDVRCSRANRRFVSLPENAVLKIPDTWGDCGVYVKGDEGTTFVFEEYPTEYADAAEPSQVAPAN